MIEFETLPVDAHLALYARCWLCKQDFAGDVLYCRVTHTVGRYRVADLACVGCAALLSSGAMQLTEE